MKYNHKRKKTTAKSLKSALPSIKEGECWVYGEGKLEADEYHTVTNAVSASMLKDMVNPTISDYEVYRKHIARDIERKTKAHFDVGTSAHMLVLEPHLYKKSVAIQPPEIKVRRGKAWDEFSEKNKDKTIITKEQHEDVVRMAKLINSNPFSSELLAGTHKEVSGFIRHHTGLIIKSRADAIHFGSRYAADLKFMDDISPISFAKSAANMGYYIQDYLYRKVFGLDEFVFICASKKEPNEVALYQLNDEYLEKAEEQVENALQRWAENLEDNRWDSFTTKSNPLTILAPPSWFKYQ